VIEALATLVFWLEMAFYAVTYLVVWYAPVKA
jgi:hypothetical protein